MLKLTIMKKAIALTVLALTVFFASGQTTRNDWFVGGSFGFTSSTQKETGVSGSTNSTIFALTPDAGYFFIDNLAAGINLNATSTHQSSGSSPATTITDVSAGPLVRYYFGIASNVKLFVHADASWGSLKYAYGYSGSPTQNSPSIPISMYDGKAGAAFFLNPNVALEFTAGYESLVEKESSGGYTTKFTTGSIVVGLGFQVYLGSGNAKKL